MDGSFLIWGIVLIGVAALLLFLEIFVPSAGLISILSVCSAIAGIICLWKHNPMWGALGGLVSLLGGPLIFIQGIKLWRHTPMGRKMVGEPTEEEVAQRRAEEEKEARELLALMGAEGEAMTDLRPVGVVRINGKRFDALSETVLIPAGSRVKVTVAEPAQIKVRPIEDRRV
jgi:membrane-bound serine protease (ClpP class)